ncbi:Gfo/Idh/MocA family protein [Microbacterium sp. LWH3-1.2]|uniref:Gfo/Idh/MocA family protein n=1 Tax=Microbacterium sp. LWH3-1.2 TaxID=3135256 RepID=UPI003434FFA8
MASELRIGILGAGGIAERAMVEPARDVDGVRVVAIGARDPERARAFAERLELPKHGDYETILSDPDIDLVYLALPPITHAQWAIRALRAGKHVLCEKPLSVNGTTASAIADAAAATGRRAFVVPQWGAALRVTAGDEPLLEEKAAEGENSYARQVEHLVAVLADGSPSILDARRGVGTMRVVDEIYRAAGLEPR